MKWLKNLFREIFIEALSGMATGLFATLIIGTIIQQIGAFIPGTVGDIIYTIGKVAASVTGVGIGVGVAARLKASPLVVVSAATTGMIGVNFGSNNIDFDFLDVNKNIIETKSGAAHF